ncbi:MAG: MFS transporter [Pseudomonadota bacterium]
MDAPERSDWRRVILLWLAGLGGAAQYIKVSVIFDRLPGIFPDAGAALGFLMSLVGFVGILLGVVAGLLVARIGYRRALIGGLWGGAALSAFQASLPGMEVFLLSRVAEGVSHLAIVVAAPTLIARAVLPSARGAALSLWGTFFGVTFAGMVWLGLPFVDWAGIPAFFLAHGVYLAVFALLLTWLLPPERPDPPDPNQASLFERHLAIYRSPWISTPAWCWLFYTLCYLSLLTLLPPFLDPAIRTFVMGAMPLVSMVSSLSLGVWLMGRYSAVRVIQIGFLSSAALALVLGIFPGSALVCLLLSAALGLLQGAGFAAVPELNNSDAARSAGNGALAQTGNIGNTLGTPIFLAVLGFGGHGNWMVCLSLVLVLGYVAQVWLARRRARAADLGAMAD